MKYLVCLLIVAAFANSFLFEVEESYKRTDYDFWEKYEEDYEPTEEANKFENVLAFIDEGLESLLGENFHLYPGECNNS